MKKVFDYPAVIELSDVFSIIPFYIYIVFELSVVTSSIFENAKTVELTLCSSFIAFITETLLIQYEILLGKYNVVAPSFVISNAKKDESYKP